MNHLFLCVLGLFASSALAWAPVVKKNGNSQLQAAAVGGLHGENSCFLPLKQLDQDYYAPRIVQIAGSYPGVTREDYFAVTSEEVPVQGQWTYDFSDPDGPQLGTVAIESSNVVACCEDPVVLIAEHTSIGVPLPDVIKEPVDIIVLCDRAANTFAERKFLVLDSPSNGVTIGAFPSRTDLPSDSEIIGQVVICQVPWLPSMKPTKTGFLEADEYF
eukprot:CAMPEP_0116139802 /NCGR_PEP_ID=MMETSP0329-20121206/13503_1 /TAXON_ID=697910 /ORGANISM="Pseudo-nitzschia arenysensis, Strain B593" /LENGTH=215 /DNA_ID=CAMNT_0003634863 /DNA_START=77 /DNA_END=724 /DNA_ORIENTATION=+